MFTLTALDYFGIQQKGNWPSLTYTVSVFNPLIKYGGTISNQANTAVNNYYPFLLSKVNGITYQSLSATDELDWPQIPLNQATNLLPIFASTSGTSAVNKFRRSSSKTAISPFPTTLKAADGYGLLYFDINYQNPQATDFVSFDWSIPTNYKVGSFYNIFNIKQQGGSISDTNTPGVGIIPQRLVLYPTNITHQTISGNDVWTVNTSAALLDAHVFNISGFNPLIQAATEVDGINNFALSALSPIASSLALAYELKALYANNNTPILQGLGNSLYAGETIYSNLPSVPPQIGGNWQNLNIGYNKYISPRIIRPDSLEWSYSVILKDSGYPPSYVSQYADEAPPHYNNFGFNYYNISTNQQLFSGFDPISKQLSAGPSEHYQTLIYPYIGNSALPLWAPENNNIDIDIQPITNTITIKLGASANNISAINLSARFVADLPYFSNINGSNNPVQSSVIEVIGVSSLSGVFIGGSALSAIQPVAILDYFTLPNGSSFTNIPCNNYYPVFFHNYTNSNAVSASWVLKFPPHYYSYKASLAPANGLALSGHQLIASLSAEAAFNYYLTSTPISSGSGYIVLSSWLYTNYQQSTLGLTACRFLCDNIVYEDQIYFDLPNVSPSIINNLQLSAGYAPNYNQLVIPLSANRWFPAISAQQITLGYVDVHAAQKQSLNIRPKLSTFAGRTDCFKNINITISPQAMVYYPPITVLQEQVGSVILSVSGLTSLSTYPFKNLNGTSILWGISGPNIGTSTNQPTISSVLAGTFITNGEPVLYDLNSIVNVFNYGVSPITVAVSSEALGTVSFYQVNSGTSTTVNQSPSPLISLISAVNENFARSYYLQLTGTNGYINYAYNEGTPITWHWSYDNVINPVSVSATFADGASAGQPYNWHATSTYGLASAINVSVEPPTDGQLNIRNLNIFATINLQNDTTELTIPVDDFPSQTAANAVYSVAYSLCANTPVFNITPDSPVFTRAADGSNIYTLKANTSSLPLISAANTTLLWLSSNLGQTNYQLLASGVSSYQLNLNGSALSALDVTLSAVNVYAYGWGNIPHNIYQTGSFYTIASAQFYKTPTFLIYPPYTWSPSGNKLTVLDNNNYTIALKPSAYNNHIGGLQDFIVSAAPLNWDIPTIEFVAGSIASLISANTGVITVPIDGLARSLSGIPVQMTVNSRAFPYTQNTVYTALNISTSGLYVSSFPSLVATTTNAAGNTGFNINPTIVDYPSLSLAISSNVSSIDLNSENLITITPTIDVSGTPLTLLPESSIITYVISSANWSYTQATSGFDPITILLQPSTDIYTPLTYDDSNLNVYNIKANASLMAVISSSTFSAYPSSQAALWIPAKQITPTTSGLYISAFKSDLSAALFVSQYHQITGQPIRFQLIPSPLPPAVSGWAYNMGDGSSTQVLTNVEPVDLVYSTPGSMILTFTAFKVGGQQATGSSLPIHILSAWPSYHQENFRSLDNPNLTLPYSLEDVLIQPNEYGVADIFNTAMSRLQYNLEYLKQNCKTLNPNMPQLYYGWLGLNSNKYWRGISWSNLETDSKDYNNLQAANELGFKNILSISWNAEYIYVLDDGKLRIFNNTGTPQEITKDWQGYNSLIEPQIGIVSIWVDPNNTTLLTANQITNKITIFNLDSNTQTITFENSLGSYGSRLEINNFYAPTYITKLHNLIYVLDYNNRCIKVYTDSLGYKFTYYTEEFQTNRIIAFSVHPNTGFVYILTDNNTLYIYESNQTDYFFKKQIIPVDVDVLKSITIDESGDFFYVTSSTTIYKFTAAAAFVNSVIISTNSDANITYLNTTFGRRLLLAGMHYMLVLEDYPSFYAIGEGAATTTWSMSSLLVDAEQFQTAATYNQSFNRFMQNLKDFRKSINASFALVTEQTRSGVTYVYFALKPIDGSQLTQKIPFNSALENEQILVGENEIHAAQTVNRPLTQLFDGIEQLRQFLSIERVNIDGLQSCKEPFCWSWKAMGLDSLTLPAIFICGTNPVSFEELMSNFPFNNGVNTTLWKNASASCCSHIKSPLNP